MSKVIPFRALRPTDEIAGRMLSPPYDVIGSAEARAAVRDNPFSFLHVTKAEIDLPPETDEYDDSVYLKAAANLRLFEERGYLVQEDPCFYVYRLVMGERVQTGLVAGVSVDEYAGGLIKRHERTRTEKVVDRTRHAATARAHTEPVMLVCRDHDAIRHLLNDAEARGTPLYDITDAEGVRHMLWRATNTMPLQRSFAGVDALYIADGHHRSESALRVRDLLAREAGGHQGSEAYNFFPPVIFPHTEVAIFEYEWSGSLSGRPLSAHTMDDVMKLADEGGIMPPKSTWFAPKLGSGLFVYTL